MMNSTVFKAQTKFEVPLHIHMAVAWHISGIDPRDGWKFREKGRWKYKEFEKYKRTKTKEAIEVIENDRDYKSEFKNYIKECVELYRKWRSEPSYLSKSLFPDKEFHFILGAGRTGGTFLTRELSRALGWPYQDSLMPFSHDQMPKLLFTKGGMQEDRKNRQMFGFGWREPDIYHNLVFQMIQYLVYLKREFPQQRRVVKKSQFSTCLQPIDKIFRDRATYVVTVRHPGACSRSWIDMGFENPSEKELEQYRESVVYGWESTYRNIVRDGVPEGKIQPVKYGPEMVEYLNKLFNNHESTKEPEPFRVTERDYDDYWKSSPVRSAIERVQTSWDLHDVRFPDLQKII